jgi:UDPglucose 6-dehydrogenase
MRDAPALGIIDQLNRLGAKVKAYDPIVSQSGLSHGLSGVHIETNPEMLADDCDALVLITEWQEFLRLDFDRMRQRMHYPLVIDGRNFLDKAQLQASGFRYIGVGHN